MTWFLASRFMYFYKRKAINGIRDADTRTFCFRQGILSQTITPLCCGRPEALLHSASSNSASGRHSTLGYM